ncbi:MAG: lysophospholipase [Alphaproteobacteria bacterium]|nr:lysophospholipase [Alphaproteobacteria bacterium]
MRLSPGERRLSPRPLRALAAAVALLCVAACAPAIDEDVRVAGIGTARAAPDPKPVPHFAETSFLAADGQRLPARKWLPSGEAKAVILALHGFNDYSNAFDAPATIWARSGIATYAYDQRGFGGAPGRAHWAGRAALAADAATASHVLRQLYPRRPLYLLGESMGGAVAVVAATGESGTPMPEVDGLVLAAPAVWGRATMQLLPKLALWAGVRVFPALSLTGRGLGITASDNIQMLRALGRDPLVLKSTRIDAIYGLVDLMDAALASAPRLSQRVLVMYGAHDELVPREPVRDFVAALPEGAGADAGTERRLAFYPQGYHMLLRDLAGPQVAEDVASWVLRPQAPLPSGADTAEDRRPWPPHRSEDPGSG